MKKFLIPATIVAMMGVGGYFGRQALDSTPSGMSELELANAEALSQSEQSGEVCYNTITTKDGCQVRYCGTCKYEPGTYLYDLPFRCK